MTDSPVTRAREAALIGEIPGLKCHGEVEGFRAQLGHTGEMTAEIFRALEQRVTEIGPRGKGKP